jgi:hypothetical protein
MKRTLLLVPLFGVTAFASYYQYWNASLPTMPVCQACRDGERDHVFTHRDGARDAQAALARGKVLILSHGTPVACFAEYNEILKRDYGIEERMIAGERVSAHLLKYVGDYNRVMEAHIFSRWTFEIFEKTYDNARALHAARHPADERTVTRP